MSKNNTNETRNNRRARKNKQKKTRNITTNQLLGKIQEIENTLMETKWFDEFDDAMAIQTSPGANNSVCKIAQGDQPFERNGDQISPIELEVRFSCRSPQTMAAPAFLRVIVYNDKGSNMADNSLFTTGGNQNALLETLITGVPAYLAPYNYLAKDKYTVWFDKVYTISQFAESGGAATYQPLADVIRIKIANMRMKFGSSAATFPITNCFKVGLVSSQTGATVCPVVELQSRILFKDS